jgi:hypothetical protein
MKKRILLLSIVLVSFTAFSFAADVPVISKNVVISFNKQFASAHDVKWIQQANFVKAEFTINDMVLFAYFNHNGELIAVTRYISTTQLPLEILTSLKSNYADYWVTDLFEIQSESGTSYFATIENADQVIILKSEGISGWQNFQRVKKVHAE